jgi:cytochrome c oxidase subunit 1
MHVLGLNGMPRRVYTYPPELPWAGLNLFVSLSSAVLATGFLIFFIDVVRSYRSGPPAGPNPWNASGLEWATSSPPPPYNFRHIPLVNSREPLWTSAETLPVTTGLRVDRREFVVSSVTAAEPEAREASPADSIWPFLSAIATSIMLIGSMFSPWAVIWGAIPMAITFTGWFWPKPTPEDES